MFDGLWTVEFISPLNRYGRGVVILNNNRLLGGDHGYYYSGTYSISGSHIQVTANVIRHDPNSVSIFGNVDHFQITFSGQVNERNFEATGEIINSPQAKVRVVGIKKEDL